MKKRIIVLFSLLTFIITSNLGVLTTSAQTLDKGTDNNAKYKVFNGYGELMYTSDSLEDAEQYLAALNSNTSERSISSVFKVARTAFKKLPNLSTPVMVLCVTYKVGQYALGKADVSDIINEIIPLNTLKEIAASLDEVILYSRSSKIFNPYPPHSYEGAMWKKNNFYYVRVAS